MNFTERPNHEQLESPGNTASSNDDSNSTFLLRNSPWKRLLISLYSFSLAIGGFALAHFPGDFLSIGRLRTLGWYIAVVFGAMGLWALALALSFSRRVAIEINRNGVINHRHRWPLIEWHEMRWIKVSRMTLEIEPLDREKFKGKMVDGFTLWLNIGGLSPGEARVKEFLSRNQPTLYRREQD